ncbi:hypothetical protein K443DRAFT_134168 [Laccaria amethystina LaAM-08-1]|uniref:Nickel/cobalt efflux system n=1 Tax=Laccaria amethystina LaAM-08-1 TaxID=1095629 RepID=A0A0C9XJB8_9AGAR|nr:hypothetical protein K443DRAFT_134168 [Laccaria amethystina LaAM-08-1]
MALPRLTLLGRSVLLMLSVTCGLFFSLGHSTIVIAVNVGIAISSSVYNRIGSVIKTAAGDAVSGSFLFIIGLANTIILWRILKRRRPHLSSEDKIQERRRMNGEMVQEAKHNPKDNNMLMMCIIGPIMTCCYIYPVGVLFGFGFDTASSIALLAVPVLARKDADGSCIASSHVVILPFLFTAGMTLVYSADSVLMLYSYSGFPERSFFEKLAVNVDEGMEQDRRTKFHVMSGLSITLTLMSILVAFR